MNLEPDASVRKGNVKIFAVLGIVRMDRCQRQPITTQGSRRRDQPCIETGGHTGAVRIAAKDESLDAVCTQQLRDRRRLRRMLELPRTVL